jgi:hypothetical protein
LATATPEKPIPHVGFAIMEVVFDHSSWIVNASKCSGLIISWFLVFPPSSRKESVRLDNIGGDVLFTVGIAISFWLQLFWVLDSESVVNKQHVHRLRLLMWEFLAECDLIVKWQQSGQWIGNFSVEFGF